MPESETTEPRRIRPAPRKRAGWIRGLWARATAPGAWRSWSAPATLGVAIAVQTVVLGWMASTLYFIWGDDYDFLLLRGTVDGVDRGLLAPHDDHWSTATILIYRLVFEFVGLRHYLPYGMVTILFHMALIVVMYLILRRLGVGPWAAAVPGIVLAFAGAASGAILWSTTMGTVGALLLGFVAILLVTRRDDGLDRAAVGWAWAALLIALMMSGAGITAVFLAALFTWLHHGFRQAAIVASVPTVIFLVWFASYGREGVKPALDDNWSYAGVPQMVWQGLSTHLERILPMTGMGAVLLVVLAVVAFVPAVPRVQRNLAMAGLLTAVFQLTLAGLTRPSFGSETFNLPRYGYYTIVLLAPALALLIGLLRDRVPSPRWVALGVSVWLLIGVLVHGEGLFHDEQADRKYVTGNGPGILRGIVAATKAGSVVLTPSGPNGVIDTRFRADLIADKGMWREVPGGEANDDERLRAEALHFTGVSTKTFSVPLTGKVELTMGWTEQGTQRKCTYHTAAVAGAVLSVESEGDGAQVGIQGPGDKVTTTLERGDASMTSREWSVTPEKTTFVGTTARDVTMHIAVSAPGTYLVCP